MSEPFPRIPTSTFPEHMRPYIELLPDSLGAVQNSRIVLNDPAIMSVDTVFCEDGNVGGVRVTRYSVRYLRHDRIRTSMEQYTPKYWID